MTDSFFTIPNISFVVLVLGFVLGVWARVEARINSSRDRADIVAKELAAYQRHVAETYVTKDGLREQIQQVMSGISDLKLTVGHVATRVDSLVDQQNAPARRNRGPAA